MQIYITLVLLLILFLGILSYAANRDIFSPTKFYIFAILLNFASIFVEQKSDIIYQIYVLYVLVGYIILGMELFYVSKFDFSGRYLPLPESTHVVRIKKAISLFWLISAVPILVNVYLITEAGGIQYYINQLAFRVRDTAGIGYILILKQILPVVNFIYLMIGLIYVRSKSRIWWALYGVHTLLVIISGLLSGSRGAALYIIVFAVLAINYLRNGVKLVYVMSVVMALIVISSILGDVRDSVKYADNEVKVSTYDSVLDTIKNTKTFQYGVMPLDAIFDEEYTDLKYGTTFLSAITIFVPRKIWPEKFETGGQELTKFISGYSGNAPYTSTMNFSPGILAESIINFGYDVGILLSFLIVMTVCAIVMNFYVKMMIATRKNIVCFKGAGIGGRFSIYNKMTMVYIYILISQWPGGLLVGEFTTMFKGLVFNIVFYLIIIKILRVYNVIYPKDYGLRPESCG